MPETSGYIAAADKALSDARGNQSINLPHQAARLAYYAQFHAAQALIFERTGKIAKTHKGVNREFHGLAKSESTLPLSLAAELNRAYQI